MASKVYTTEEIELSDDSIVVLKPLNIKGLREFMAKFEEFAKAESEDESFEILLDAGAICLRKDRPEFWDENRKVEVEVEGVKKTVSKPGHSELFEEIMDMQTVYRVLKVCGGVDLNDPNLIAAATEALKATGTP